jgi:hypothetical protein
MQRLRRIDEATVSKNVRKTADTGEAPGQNPAWHPDGTVTVLESADCDSIALR